MTSVGIYNCEGVLMSLRGLSPLANYTDNHCGLVVRVPGYRFRGPWFDSLRYQVFWEVVGLERDPLSAVSIIEDLLERKSGDFCLEIRDYGRMSPKVGTNFFDKRRSLGRRCDRSSDMWHRFEGGEDLFVFNWKQHDGYEMLRTEMCE
jgi:hypothetical protein